MPIASVIFRNHKYYYKFENDTNDHELFRSGLTSIIIPGDKIHVENHSPIAIVDRVPQHTVAIIRGISGGQAFLYCPLISPFFNPSIPLAAFQTPIEIGSRLLVHITKDAVAIKKEYSLIIDRKQDRQIIDDLYNTSDFDLSSITSSSLATTAQMPLYTKPPQDQTDLPTFTVDPAESRDFDDAISIVGNTVYVHIVDIHAQMPPSSPEEKEAARLGFTLYTPEGNHNIVPAEKAEHEWSLIADHERKVITIEIRYNDEYNVDGYDIYPATIVVKHRYNYDNAPSIHLAKVLTERVQRTHYTIPQLQLTVNSTTGQVYGVQHSINTDMNHRMIETFMVTANMIVSDHLRARSPSYANIPQRFHRKLRGLPTHPPTGDPIVDSFLAIKTYAYAIYDPEKCGHYGLKLQSYTHFTSPIRRYFDVLIHRMLAGVQYSNSELQTILDHLNRREQAIAALAKLYEKWKLLATINVGDTWDVIVTRVTAAGIYYLYKPYMMDGFIHVSALGGARWYLQGDELRAAPDQILRLGSCLKCRVTEVDVIKQLVSIASLS